MPSVGPFSTGRSTEFVGVRPEDQIKLIELVEVIPYEGFDAWQIVQRAEGRRQYINLDSQMIPNEAHPEFGRCIHFKARVAWAAGDPARPLDGKYVRFSFLPDPGNLPAQGDQRAGFDAPGDCGNDIAPTDADGWTKVSVFYVSTIGGDKFDIVASCETNEMKTGNYVVWRKLWYEVDTMKKRGGGTLDLDHPQLPGLLDPCFIELVQKGTDNQPENKWNLQTSELHDFADDYFGAEASPYQFQEVAIDHQADKKAIPSPVEIKVTASVYTDGTTQSYWVYDGPTDWLKRAEYKVAIDWQSLDNSRVTLVGSDPILKKIRVDLSSFTVPPSATTPIMVRLDYLLAKEWVGDGTYKPHSLVAMGYLLDGHSAADAKKLTYVAMVHELGHLLGLVPTTSPKYVLTPGGAHCNDTDCVMYASNSLTRPAALCSVCREIVLRTDFAAVESNFTHGKGSKA